MKISSAAVTATAIVWITVLASLANGQGEFPDEPGRDTLILACTQCHALGKMVVADLTKDDWEFIVYDMIGRGAPVHEEDLTNLVKYLQNNFASDK